METPATQQLWRIHDGETRANSQIWECRGWAFWKPHLLGVLQGLCLILDETITSWHRGHTGSLQYTGGESIECSKVMQLCRLSPSTHLCLHKFIASEILLG